MKIRDSGGDSILMFVARGEVSHGIFELAF